MLLSITFSGGPRIVDKSADEVEFLAIQIQKLDTSLSWRQVARRCRILNRRIHCRTDKLRARAHRMALRIQCTSAYRRT